MAGWPEMIEEEGQGGIRQLSLVCIEPITLPELESHLARAADLLRGAVDQADFKAFIFPLMFFKRISDTYLVGLCQVCV